MKVDSSLIADVTSVVTDEEKGLVSLWVTFHKGSGYCYSNVPAATVDAMVNADSVGMAFNSLIRGKYEYRRVS